MKRNVNFLLVMTLSLVVFSSCTTTGNGEGQSVTKVLSLSDVDIESPSNSFSDNGDGTVSNVEMDLMWQADDDGVSRNGLEALTYAQKLKLGGHVDWRLPTEAELIAIKEAKGDLFRLSGDTYYTSTHQTVYTPLAHDYGETPSEEAYVICVREITDPDLITEVFQ